MATVYQRWHSKFSKSNTSKYVKVLKFLTKIAMFSAKPSYLRIVGSFKRKSFCLLLSHFFFDIFKAKKISKYCTFLR